MLGSFKYEFCTGDKTSFTLNNDTDDDDEFYQKKASHKPRHLVTDNQRSSGWRKAELNLPDGTSGPDDRIPKHINSLACVQNKMD